MFFLALKTKTTEWRLTHAFIALWIILVLSGIWHPLGAISGVIGVIYAISCVASKDE